MSHREVMDLPLHLFWLRFNQIGRIEADKAKRAFQVALHAQAGGEHAQAFMDGLHEEVGTVVRFGAQQPGPDWTRDEQGIAELKLLQHMGAA